MIVAGIGTRNPTDFQSEAAYKLGRFLVANGHTLKSGGAIGIDQHFARGGNSVDPTKVVVCVPWQSYEEGARHPKNQLLILGQMPKAHQLALASEAATHHPVWIRLSQGAQKLMMRNGLIIDQCDLVLACPSPRGGGTRQGMVVGQARGIHVIDFSRMTQSELSAVCQEILRSGAPGGPGGQAQTE